MVIREALASDRNALQSLYEELVSRNVLVTPTQIERFLKDDDNFLFVCDDSGLVLGTAQLGICMDAMFNNQPFAVVENVIVDSRHRRKGVGMRLLHHIETVCRARHCTKIMLVSGAERHGGHALFKRAGYVSDAMVGFKKYLGQSKGKGT